ncbi:MAG: hypothetical protein HQL06_12240 [Nitrospirae bacterium]|nr:hypothetical protein [Nitrospirota bacterium]
MKKRRSVGKNWIVVICVFLMVMTIEGCGFVGDGPFGWGLTYNKLPIAKGSSSNVNKTGQACIYSFMGAISIGDGSIEAAMRAGGITNVYTIDSYNLNFFGLYTRQCTIVLGG